MKIVVVIPTYNEAENIGKLIEVLEEERKLIPGHDVEVLVVDGNSPDGTSDVVRVKSERYPWVYLLVELNKSWT